MKGSRAALIWLLIPLLAWSCTSQPQKVSDSADSNSGQVSSTPDTFKVITYNAWHGLNVGSFWATPSETPERNKARFRFQVQQLARVNPDLVFLQEVNPLPQRAEEYVKALQAHGLEYSEVHQVDACGIRVSQNRALISELNNGLVILAKKRIAASTD